MRADGVAMRFAGRISDWNDDKGFGFVTPNGGGARAFVHIGAFQGGGRRRPLDGDLISYEIARDARGRSTAVRVRFAGQRRERRAPRRRVPRAALGGTALAVVAAGGLLGVLPMPVAGLYGLLSLVSFCMYWLDKTAAGAGRRRTPEKTLHLVDLLGGWPGALLAQHRFRHKTAKASFQAIFRVTAVANVGVVGWLVWSGRASIGAAGWP
ncbi:DUF1294 domain-containing protein [Coralloluteibacterium thermophilus]|uniref:DUF1294 domain-containing protein n=1 Tax=Coralloluteibacterium thermophilum TaxID=2707049 RepID=A0ABV9NK83_9GAMM